MKRILKSKKKSPIFFFNKSISFIKDQNDGLLTKFKYLNDNIEKFRKFGKSGNILLCIYSFYAILSVSMVMIHRFIVIIFGFR